MDNQPTPGGNTLERSVHEQLISELKYAIRRERYSRMRYEESARLARSDELKALLNQLAEEECVHEAKLQKELQRLIAQHEGDTSTEP